MAFVNNVRMAASKAMGAINSLSRQAKSYSTNPNMLRAKSVATSLARSPQVMIGAGVGAAAGVGYNSMGDPRRSTGSKIGGGIRAGAIGAMLGAGGGAAYKNRGAISAYGRSTVAKAQKWSNSSWNMGAVRGAMKTANNIAGDLADRVRYHAGL